MSVLDAGGSQTAVPKVDRLGTHPCRRRRRCLGPRGVRYQRQFAEIEAYCAVRWMSGAFPASATRAGWRAIFMPSFLAPQAKAGTPVKKQFGDTGKQLLQPIILRSAFFYQARLGESRAQSSAAPCPPTPFVEIGGYWDRIFSGAWGPSPQARCTTRWERVGRPLRSPTWTWRTWARYRFRAVLKTQPGSLGNGTRASTRLQIIAKLLVKPEPHAGKTYNLIGEYQAGNQIVRHPVLRHTPLEAFCRRQRSVGGFRSLPDCLPIFLRPPPSP
jgi:hypothetical protein